MFTAFGCAADVLDVDGGTGADGATEPPATPGATTADSIPADGADDYFGERAGGSEGLDPDAARTCFDGIDNDEEMADGLDCGDPDCAGVASCIVGNGNLCTDIASDTLPITACAEMPVTSSCIGALAAPFGSPSPWVATGALHPGGDDAESGIVFENTVALRSHRLALSATIQEPACGAGDPCLDTVALGVTSQSKTDLVGGAPMRAHVALAYSGARREVSLQLSGAVAARWPMDDGMSAQWTLILRPDGLIDVLNGSTSLFTEVPMVPYAPIDGARVVVFGRSMNRAYPAPDGAALTSLAVGTSVCDIPSAWEERGPVAFGVASGGAPVAIDGLAEVSTAIDGSDGRRYLVYRQAGDADRQERFLAAFETTIGPETYRLAYPLDSPILEPDTAFDGGGIADPELFWDGALFHLYYTATHRDTGVRSIAHASGASLDALTKDTAPIIDPGLHGLLHVEMPSHARSGGGVDVLIARGVEQSAHRLIAFGLVDGVWARVAGSDLDALTRREEGVRVEGRFDGEEIAHPSIARVGGSFHIYYAGRRGTRWGIGLLATDELLYLRDVTAGVPLLQGSNDGFDALSTLEPDVLVEEDRVSLFYIGTDGARRTVGRVARSRGSGE